MNGREIHHSIQQNSVNGLTKMPFMTKNQQKDPFQKHGENQQLSTNTTPQPESFISAEPKMFLDPPNSTCLKMCEQKVSSP